MKSVLLTNQGIVLTAIEVQLAVQRSLCHLLLPTSLEVILRATLYIYFEKPFWDE